MKKIFSVVILIILLGAGIYFYQSKNDSTPSEKASSGVSTTPQVKRYVNKTYNYEFAHIEPPFFTMACVNSAQGTKLQKANGTEDFVIIYEMYATSSPTLPPCVQSNDWYKVKAYQASVLAIKESESAWKQRVIDFQNVSPDTLESPKSETSLDHYQKVTRIGIHTTLLRGENVQVMETDTQIISRHNDITYSIRFDTGGRTAVLMLLNTLKFGK